MSIFADDVLLLAIRAKPPPVRLAQPWKPYGRRVLCADVDLVIVIVTVFVHALRVQCIRVLRPVPD